MLPPAAPRSPVAAGDPAADADAPLTGPRDRHRLAVSYLGQGRRREAEALWRAAVAEDPGFVPARAGLGELCVRDRDWAGLDRVAAALDGLGPGGEVEAAALRARWHLARQEFAAARELLARAAARHPDALPLRVLTSHAWLLEGADDPAAERAVRAVLEVAPGHPEARHNLAVLLRRRGREAEAAPAGLALADLYRAACARPSDVNQHLPTLYRLALQCRHVTEFGTRTGVSTIALLHAQPDRLVCYDRVRLAPVDRLARLAGKTAFEFREADVLSAEIEETDLLFVDTWHVYEQLRAELDRHAGRVRRWVALHDTQTFREAGESPGHRGLWPAVEEFLARGAFRLAEHHPENNGLTVLERVGDPGPAAGPNAG